MTIQSNMTVLDVVQTIGKEINAPYPTTLFGNVSPDALQLLALYYATGRGLRQAKCWPQLKRSIIINTGFGTSLYALPNDYFCSLLDTFWDTANKWKMAGPLSDSKFNELLWGYAAFSNREYVRFFGQPGTNQFQVQPPPGNSSIALSFEYICKSWMSPQFWVAGTTYTGNVNPLYVNNFGNTYKYTGAATAAGTVPPNMARGVGLDGNVYWTFINTPAWIALTVYGAGDYVLNGGNYYICTIGGTSAGAGGPTGSGGVDGTVTWAIISVSSWAPETAYARGVYVIAAASRIYLCSNPNIASNTVFYSGKTVPNWTATTVSDGVITWTWIDTSYETITSDTDFSVFDDELMLLGLKWRWLREKGEEYESVQEEYQAKVDTAMARWQGNKKICFGGSDLIPAGLDPNIQEGSFNFS